MPGKTEQKAAGMRKSICEVAWAWKSLEGVRCSLSGGRRGWGGSGDEPDGWYSEVHMEHGRIYRRRMT